MNNEDSRISDYFIHGLNKHSENIEQLNINAALMINQYKDIQKTLEKIIYKLEKLEGRLGTIEKERLAELSKNQTKTTIIEHFFKYWWIGILTVFFFISNDTHFLESVIVKSFKEGMA